MNIETELPLAHPLRSAAPSLSADSIEDIAVMEDLLEDSPLTTTRLTRRLRDLQLPLLLEVAIHYVKLLVITGLLGYLLYMAFDTRLDEHVTYSKQRTNQSRIHQIGARDLKIVFFVALVLFLGVRRISVLVGLAEKKTWAQIRATLVFLFLFILLIANDEIELKGVTFTDRTKERPIVKMLLDLMYGLCPKRSQSLVIKACYFFASMIFWPNVLVVSLMFLLNLLVSFIVSIVYLLNKYGITNIDLSDRPPDPNSRAGQTTALTDYQLKLLVEMPFDGRKEEPLKDPSNHSRSDCVCSICFNSLTAGTPVIVLPGCEHVFDKDCILFWLKTKPTCPLCRKDVRLHLKAEDRDYFMSWFDKPAFQIE